MIRFEDIIEDARRFLQNKMSKEEAAYFRQLIESHPHLKEEFEVMRKMVAVMRELPAEEIESRLQHNPPRLSDGSRTRYSRWLILLILVLAVTVVLLMRKHKGADQIEVSLENPGLSTFAGKEKSGLFANTASSLAMDQEGNVYIAGNFHREITFGNLRLTGDSNSLDFFLLKLTPDLQVGWAKSYGGPGDDFVDQIAVTNQSQLIFSGRIGDTLIMDEITLIPKSKGAGRQASDLFLARMDQDHNIQWAINDGNQSVPYVSSGTGSIIDLAVDFQDNIYAVGEIGATSIFSYTLEQTKGINSFIVKLAPEGEIRWLRSLTGEYGVRLYGIDTWRDRLVVTGRAGHVNLGGDIVLGDSIRPLFGGTDIITVQYDAEGIMLWSQLAGTSLTGNDDSAFDVKFFNNGNFAVTGNFSGTSRFGKTEVVSTVGRDFFLAAYQADGLLQWIASGGGGTMMAKNTDLDMGAALDVDDQGNIYVCGIFAHDAVFDKDTLQPNGIQDLFVAKYDMHGDLVWIKPFGGDSEQVNMERAMDIAVNNNGDCFVTGYFSGNLFIEDQKLEAGGQLNIFILALDRTGRIRQFNKLLFATVTGQSNEPI